MAPSATGVAFANRLPERADFNILNYLYYYNGGGVAVGDVDGDGRQDLYFSANLDSNRLYLNRGNYRFEDVTARAGVGGPPGWKTGVTMADVNGDGRPDIYASAVEYRAMRGRNALYVNNGDGTFTERAREYGLDFAGYATQAAFFDYDRDGDLDAFLLTHLTSSERQIGGGRAGDPRHPRGGGLLFRNDRLPNGECRFTDVTAAAGITGDEGYGLGVVVSDLNDDGLPDLYLAIDFQGNDRLYLNDGDGTFSERVTRAARHTSRFSMGVDAADADGDLRPDLFVADMMPEREDVLKSSASSEGFNLFNLRLRAGYQPQYPRNTLQLNLGTVEGDTLGDTSGGVPRFAEVGYQAGVQATDWSWGALFADLDLDGRKDLFVTNGIFRRPNDLDYINYVGNDAVQAALARGDTAVEREMLRRMPQIALPNHAFQNRGAPGAPAFADVAAAWGLAEPGFSNGAAYVDLDNRGALDLVVNRINAPAAIYRSRARERTGNAALTVTLRGDGGNTAGVGARVYVAAGGRTQLVEQSPTRGFLSSVDPRPHFGLGRAARVDSVRVVWPDGREQVRRDVGPNQVVPFAQADAVAPAARARPVVPAPLFAEAAGTFDSTARHAENPFLDTDVQPLLPRLLSREGPALAAADVNGDGLDDLFLGGAKWQRGQVLVQAPNGTFRPTAQPAIATDSVAEDVAAAFLDADRDGDQDLFVAAGGNEFAGSDEPLRPRLYLNDGRGTFARAPAGAVPNLFVTASCVAAGDYDGDGDADLFVGGRAVSRAYGQTPRSYLLRNDGGRFVDVTAQAAPALAAAGMVTGAAWTDQDGDGRLDLVTVGEWAPVRLFRQEAPSRFADRSADAGLGATEGWWSTVRAADLDGDRRDDLVLGNAGLNSYVRATSTEPARLYVHDFGGNGTLEQVLTFYKRGVSYPLAGRDDLVRLVPGIRAKYPSYASFGASTVEQIFPAEELRRAAVLEARTMASAVAMNGGRAGYTLRPLPAAAQAAPVRATLADDFDGDGRVDLLLGGNDHGAPPVLGRYDASYGLLLRGRGDGTFAPAGMGESGLALDGEVRAMARVRTARGPLVVVARNDDRPFALRPARGGSRTVAARRER